MTAEMACRGIVERRLGKEYADWFVFEQKQQEINAAEAERKQHQDELNEKIANLEAVLSTVKEARAKVC